MVKWHRMAATLASVGFVRKMTTWKSSECDKYELFEHLLLSFVLFVLVVLLCFVLLVFVFL